jgi:hypothetical protein
MGTSVSPCLVDDVAVVVVQYLAAQLVRHLHQQPALVVPLDVAAQVEIKNKVCKQFDVFQFQALNQALSIE